MQPVEIRAPQGAKVLSLEWEDGQVSELPHWLLRGFCPCAHCQGHQGPVRFALTPEQEKADAPLTIADLSEVGNYALRIDWGDGHNTGLYRFTFLRELAAVGGDANVRTLRFGR